MWLLKLTDREELVMTSLTVVNVFEPTGYKASTLNETAGKSAARPTFVMLSMKTWDAAPVPVSANPRMRPVTTPPPSENEKLKIGLASADPAINPSTTTSPVRCRRTLRSPLCPILSTCHGPESPGRDGCRDWLGRARCCTTGAR